MQKPTKTILSLALISLIESQGLHAGGFSLYTESSPAAIGNFGAGLAASGEDASTAWYNPAALILLKNQQMVLGGVGVFPSSKLSGQSTYNTSISGTPAQYKQNFSGLQGGENALVPSLHYFLPLGPRAAFGFSLVSPFGLSTNYTQGSPVRYSGTKSEFETIDISPDIAGLITEHFSIGGGIDLQYARVKFNRMIGLPAYLQFYNDEIDPGSGLLPTTLDSSSNNTGDSFAIGFHTGFLFMFDDNHTRIGLNYQSGMKHQFNGTSQLTGRLADSSSNLLIPLEANQNAQYTSHSLYSNDIQLPQIVTLSTYKDLNNKFALLGSVVWTGWSSFKAITLNNVAVPVFDPDRNVSNGLGSSTTPEDYRNTWRVALGANYHVTDKWMMRVGTGYDQTPTVTAHRDVRLPDSDRWALSIGTHYQMRPNIGFDVGYTYLFAVNNAIVNNTQAIGTSSYNVDAISKNHAQLVGLQAVWMIDQTKETTK